jgi:hypothetical protein
MRCVCRRGSRARVRRWWEVRVVERTVVEVGLVMTASEA